MSSEEVAELAQAIHNHADALYESWTKGQEAMNMKRMEDTLELLADPGLTPKLEHLVSSFVRRDKAKRQFQQQQPTTQTRQKSPPKSLDPQDISQQNDREPSPGSFGRTKALPKSILAVVQRFEQPQQPQDITRERSPSQMFAPVVSSIMGNNHHHNHHHDNNNSVVDGGNKVNVAGVGQVTRNVMWAESSSNRQQVTERKVGRVSSPSSSASPSPSPVGNKSGGTTSSKTFSSVQHSRSFSTSPSSGGEIGTGVGKERHIPIQRYDEPSNTSNGTTTVKTNGYSPSSIKSNGSVLGMSNTQKKMELLHHPLILNSSPVPYKNEMRELEREEERLFQALRTGQLVHGTFANNRLASDNSLSPRGGIPASPSEHGLPSSPPLSVSPNGSNGYSRVAFAKERIRQSQQHPMTQQRLEFKNRLPSPSGSLAAAIALQQGKQKFQPSQPPQNGTSPSPAPLITTPLFTSVDDESAGVNRENQYTGGYHSRFNGFRFGPGSSVADRVQMFEKYPTSSIALTSPPQSPGSSSASSTSSAPVSPSATSRIDAVTNISNSIVAARKQQLQQQPSSSSTTTPWRGSPIRETSLNVASPSPTINHLISNANNLTKSPTTSTSSTTNGNHQQPFHSSHAPHLHPQQLFQIHIDTSASGIPKGQSSPKTPLSSPRGSGNNKRTLAKDVPRFYFPEGKPVSPTLIQDTLAKAEEEMKNHNSGRVAYAEFAGLLSAAGIPIFWKKPFWMAMGLGPEDVLSAFTYIPFLRNLLTDCPDDASRFMRLLHAAAKNAPNLNTSINNSNNNNTINASNNNNTQSKFGGLADAFKDDVRDLELHMSDFVPMVQDIIDTHQGLGFLRDAPEFHSRYITTVVSRVFYKVNRSWSGKMTLSELRRSNLLRIIKRLETETDINNVTEYFSYEHFYVIYCKFWELDKDHDLLIDKNDLRGHADHALSGRIIERIFSGTVLRGWDMTTSTRAPTDKMTYSDFVWFLLSEEDKKTPTAIEYWFRCLDLDGDGVLSPFELQYFYCEQETRIEALGIEPLDFANVYCQFVDMLQCPSTVGIRLKDCKRNPQLAACVFNTLFNLDKYLEHEQRDPFAAAASGANNPDGFEAESDWDKFASAEYDSLIAEETPSDHMHNSDFEEAISPT